MKVPGRPARCVSERIRRGASPSGRRGLARSSAGDTARLIRAFAAAAAKPSVVYNLAQIPPPPSPSPAPPPAQPTELTVTLDASGGNLTLRRKAANPAGTSGGAAFV